MVMRPLITILAALALLAGAAEAQEKSKEQAASEKAGAPSLSKPGSGKEDASRLESAPRLQAPTEGAEAQEKSKPAASANLGQSETAAWI